MDREQVLLLVIDDLKQKLADAEHSASDYRAQALLYQQRVKDLEWVQEVIDGTPELKASIEAALKDSKGAQDATGNL